MWFLELITNFLNITSDGCQPGTLSMASRGLVQMINLSTWNFVRLVHIESYQRRSLVAIRYTACV
jgi:hypothetical protein